MSVVVLLKLPAKAGRTDELRALLDAMLPTTRQASGCLSLICSRSRDEPRCYLVVQHWSSRSDYLTYSAWRRDKGDLEPLEVLLDGAPSLTFHEVVEVY